MTDHEDYEGLAAGYALHALEPEDEQRLAAHLLTCRDCARLVADSAAVGAAFAELAAGPAQAPPAGLRQRILDAAAAEPRVPTSGSASMTASPAPAPRAEAPGPPLRPAAPEAAPVARRARPLRIRSRVAVGVLAAAIGVGVAVPITWELSRGSSSTSNTSALEQWLLKVDAREITLQSSSSKAIAKAVMADDGAYLVASGLAPNNRADSTYVLWAAPAAGGAPTALGAFDVHGDAPVQLTVPLPMKPSEVGQVAISLEKGRQAPQQPTDVLLRGTA